MGAVDLFDYFEDDNKDLADDKQEVVLKNVENQSYKALVLRFIVTGKQIGRAHV